MSAVEVHITFPSAELAEATAAALVETRAAACGQVMPITSVYRWEGKVTRDPEYLLILKTLAAALPRIEADLKGAHPYDVPQITALAITGGSADYIEWIEQSVTP